MINPTHKVKRYVVSNDAPPYRYEDAVNGWLATGIKDKHGREIFEGDKVQFGNKTYKVICGLGYGLCLEDYKRMCQELRTQARFDHDKGYAFSLEIVND